MKTMLAAGPSSEPTQAFTVAPKPVQLAERIAPSVQFPGLQGNPHDPARSLLHGGPELPWKVAAGGYRRNRDEDLRTAEAMEPEAVLIILGQTFRLEDTISVRRSEPVQRIA